MNHVDRDNRPCMNYSAYHIRLRVYYNNPERYWPRN